MHNLEENIWKDIYKNSYIIWNNIRVISFNYLLLNRTIACKKKLTDWRIKDSPECNFCESMDDTLHFMLYCESTKTFWKHSLNWWNSNIQKENIILHINLERWDLDECILFGFPRDHNKADVLNLIFLHAKFYIYKVKMKQKKRIFMNTFSYYKNN